MTRRHAFDWKPLLCMMTLGMYGCAGLQGRSDEVIQASHTVQIDDTEEISSSQVVTKTGSIQRRLTKAESALAEDDLITAEAELKSILTEQRDHSRASHLLAIVHVNKGDSGAAEEQFLRALKGDSRNAKLHCDYGYFLYLNGHWDTAKDALTKAANLDPKLLESHTNLGMLLARQGKLSEAKEQFRLAGCSEAEILNNVAFAQLLERDYLVAQATYFQAQQLGEALPETESGLRLVSRALQADENSK